MEIWWSNCMQISSISNMGTCDKIYLFSFSVNQGPPPPRPWIQLSTLQQGRPTGIYFKNAIFSIILQSYLSKRNSKYIIVIFIFHCSNVHGNVLQCSMWPIRYSSNVWLLSPMGPQLGIPKERNTWWDSSLQVKYIKLVVNQNFIWNFFQIKIL